MNYYVIERGAVAAPIFLTVTESQVTWQGEVEGALQFHRRVDAENYANQYIVGLMAVDEYRIAEYEYVEA